MLQRMLSIALGVTLGSSAVLAQKAETREPASEAEGCKFDLDAHNFLEFHALIRPHDNEWRHLKVEWLTDVVAARKQAAAQDKPIVICYTGGAGYNEPLGVC
jgi:hypothetical protein